MIELLGLSRDGYKAWDGPDALMPTALVMAMLTIAAAIELALWVYRK